jgi:hypothetical protein
VEGEVNGVSDVAADTQCCTIDVDVDVSGDDATAKNNDTAVVCRKLLLLLLLLLLKYSTQF